jgi:hypothetical protein
LWIDKGGEFVHNLIAIIFKNGNLRNLVAFDSVARGLYVDDGVQTLCGLVGLKLWINGPTSKCFAQIYQN